MNVRGKTQKPNERRNGTPKIISQGRDKYHVWRKGKGGQRGKDIRETKKQREKGKKRGRRSHGGKKHHHLVADSTRKTPTNRASKGAIGAQEVLLGPLFERRNTRRQL